MASLVIVAHRHVLMLSILLTCCTWNVLAKVARCVIGDIEEMRLRV